MLESAIPIIAIIGLLSLLCQWLAWWVKLPAILFLLLTGIAVGPWLGWVNPDDLLGELFFPVVSLSVAIILFEGSLTLKFEEIRGLATVVRRLVSIGMLVTWGVMSYACYTLLDFSLPMSLLFGALVVVTGPTVIIPMLRSVRPNSRIASILRWEGIVIDPIGALLAVLVYESIISLAEGSSLSHTLVVFVKTLVIGGSLGCLAGYVLGLLLRHGWLPVYLHNLGTISLVLGTFALSNLLQHESGLLAVTLMGIWLANMRDVNVEDILSFKENLSILLISALFILLAARIELNELIMLGWPALILLAVIQFVARPLAVMVSTLGSDLSWRERSLVAWIGPRGIVAAAISAFFAIRLQDSGIAGAQMLVPLTFIIIIGTVVLQSATARILARMLNVAEPSPRGFLIIGANIVARKLANILTELNYRVLLTDTSWDNIRTARMEGLNTFYGNPVSEYADTHLDLVGIGRLMAVSPQRELNALSSMRYRLEFGQKHLFTLPVLSDTPASEKHLIASRHKGRTLFSEDLTYGKFASLLNKGAKISSTSLTDSFGYDELLVANPKLYCLFAIDKAERLHVVTEENPVTPQAGWTVVTLNFADIAQNSEQ